MSSTNTPCTDGPERGRHVQDTTHGHLPVCMHAACARCGLVARFAGAAVNEMDHEHQICWNDVPGEDGGA